MQAAWTGWAERWTIRPTNCWWISSCWSFLPGFAVGQRADAIIRPGTETALRVLRSDCPEAGAPLWVEREGRAVPVQARLGRAGEDYVEVLEGLQEGDRVLRPRTPGHSFQPLERVTIQEERP